MQRSIYEWVAIALLLSASTVGVVLFGAVRNWSAGSLMVLVYAGIALVLLRPLLDRALTDLRIPPGSLPLLAFLVYTAFLLPSAAVPYEARIELLKIGSYLGAYWAWTELSSRYQRWRFLLGIPLLVGTFVALYALVQHAQGSTMVLNMARPEQYEMRASGTFMAPTHFAAYLGTMLCLAACLIPMKSAGFTLRLLAGYGMIIFLPLLFLSHSRSGWVGATMGLSVVVWMTYLRRSIWGFIISLVAVPAAFGGVFAALWNLSPIFRNRVHEGLQVRGTAAHRIDMWRDTWVMIQDKLLIGHGPGSYRWVYPPYKTWTADRWLRYAHNEYLHLWAEYGLIGLVIMTLVFGVVLIGLIWKYRRIERDRDAGLVAGFTGAVCAALGHAVFDFNLHVFSLCHVLVLFGGVTMGCLFADRELKARSAPLLLVRTACGVAVLMALWAGAVSFQAAASGAWTRLGEDKAERVDLRTMTLLNEAESYFLRAVWIDPANWLPYLELGDATRRRAFWILDPEYKEEKAREALAWYEKAYERNLLDMNVVYGMGRCWFMLGDEEQSLAYLRRTTEYWPANFFYIKQLGLQLRQMGRTEEARDAFLKARAIDSADPVVRTNLRLLEEELQTR